jgi:uncharacterized protein YdhG (YjbR/CyaY superfamily)
MQSSAKSVTEYLAALPDDRRAAISKVRAVIRKNLPKGFEETMQCGMISYVVPHKLYPAGYHCKPADPLPFASLASQKNYMALYLMSVYQHEGMAAMLKERFAAAGKKLDMGKSCIRFKKLEDLPLDVIGETLGLVSVADYIARYEAILGRSKQP